MGAASNIHLEYLPHNFLCLGGVIAQTMLLIALIKDPLKCFKNSSTYLVANLALSDLAVSIHGPFSVYLRLDFHWNFDFFDFTLYVSLATIFSIAVDRYLMVVHPFKHRYLMHGKKVVGWVGLIWLLSLCIPLKKIVFGNNTYDIQIISGLGMAITLCTGLAYAVTYFFLRQQARRLAAQDVLSTVNFCHQARITKEKQFLKTIIIVSCIAVSTLLPLAVFSTVVHPRDSLNSASVAILPCILVTIFYFNFVINPFIYVWRLPKYRRTFYLLYCG